MPLRRADELIASLLARQQAAPILEKTTGLPYGWALWLRALTPLQRPFHARDVIAVLLPRPLPGAPGRLPALGFAQALRRLFWQDWDPAPRDQRWMRWVSSLASVLLHLLFFVLLLWVAMIRPPASEREGGEGERIQVEFLGQGTQEGGGEQPGAAEAIAAAASAAAAAAQAEAEAAGWAAPARPQPAAHTAQATQPPPAAAPPSPAEPAPAAEPVPSPPVQATDVVQASTDFVVPPVSHLRTEVRVVPRAAEVPAVRERSVQAVQAPQVPTPVTPPPVRVPTPALSEPQVREREIAQVDPAPAMPPLRPVEVRVRTPQRDLQVQEREVTTVSAESVQLARVPVPEPGVRDRQVPQVAVRERSVTAREPAPALAASTATAAADGRAATAAMASPARSAVPAGQAGARSAPAPGNWATPARGDDWGASSRDRPGAARGAQASTGGQGQGLFNADGSVRVPGQEGAAGGSQRGAPGGDSDGWTKDRIAQSGTWLKRPPYDYTPTSFDKYWVPQESLLAEWVRKGIKSLEIPLPGTSTKISCVISLLQAGGGCGLSDPNMQDQPAIARPPPDIPFKKELQEDNGSR
ncbi:hypothetical protein [Stenotrophomonas sp. 24(2023)]|uniref:hypothetical protein n=1 Tax=Stenotrophomonas sp. 24(2023) TaxID=3068324 RepID=UPI0027DFF86B|nr:hypothetical protein [Stenotrophomonas sp. 24(2023)]WMJ69793.1 hypothetical protein Q9R17_01380 [Stenotrophomonas sp. 24(2023)]